MINRSILLFLFFVLSISCKKEAPKIEDGVLSFIRGDVKIQRGASLITADKNTKIQNGDIILTSNESTALVEFGDSTSIEIQSGSKFKIEDTGDNKKFFQDEGNSWIQTQKLKANHSLIYSTPTTAAGVRGTKFYSFQFGDDIRGTCHCEGTIEYQNLKSNEKKVNDQDYMVFYKGEKSIVITSEDLKTLPHVPENLDHDHSELDNSKLGKHANTDPDFRKEFSELVFKKFQEIE